MMDLRILAVVAGVAVASAAEAESPWVPLFTGHDLAGWSVQCKPKDRDKNYWTASDGVIRVDSVGDRDHNYVWLQSDAEFGDFELRLKFKIFRSVPGNSGVQIRSRYDADAGWLDGPQFDIHPPLPRRTGLIYDETRGVQRWIHPSLEPGDHTILPAMANPKITLLYNDEGWNEMVIIAQGTHLKALINGEVASDYDGSGVLDDLAHQRHRVGMKGHIALQLHNRDELKAEFKDMYVRER